MLLYEVRFMSKPQTVKQVLKRILPPPTESFMREIIRLRRENEELRDLLKKAAWGDYFLSTPEAIYAYLLSIPEYRYPEEICRWYYRETGQPLNLSAPKTFNEKIQWLKLFDSTPLKTCLTDKYLVREWIQKTIGEQYLIPIIGMWDSFEKIDFKNLPNKFVLKATHGSGWNIVVKDKSKLDREEAKKKFDKWMNLNFAFVNGLELHYLNITPKIIAEKYIEQIDGNLLDYKIHVFNDEPKIIQVIGDRDLENHTAKESFMTLDWVQEDLMYHTYDVYSFLPQKPENLDEMLSIAKTLGTGFRYVRVDLYNINGRILFGEMTFTPASGVGKWTDFEVDKKIGSWIKL